MRTETPRPFINTIKSLCRMCYTCVRECPAKAIRIIDGQAAVIPERCIACGNCVKVCSQGAKRWVSSLEELESLLKSGKPTAACIAPSFPAEFVEYPAEVLVGMLRKLGFKYVTEVAFGAELVAEKYRKLFDEVNGHRYISTCCPAIIGYVERYYPNLLDSLAPIVSPMVAMARVLHKLHGSELKIVFIGPCVAKKAEAVSQKVPGEVDVVLTFTELREYFEMKGVMPGSVTSSDFDPPFGSTGNLFPISHGMLQTAGIQEDLIAADVVSTEGRSNFIEALREFAEGNLDVKLLEVLCCQGCIMGPGMSNSDPLFRKRSSVSRYTRKRLQELDTKSCEKDLEKHSDINLHRCFSSYDQRIRTPDRKELEEILIRMGKKSVQDELNCGACGYDTCVEHAIAIYEGLAESEMCLPYTIDRLKETVGELAISHDQLANAQEALMQSEKLASMGQLAAGVAHEVNNPLAVVLMYAHILLEECPEGSPMREDLKTIVKEADRCKKIVAGLLNFARKNRLMRQPRDIKELVSQALKILPAPPNVLVKTLHNIEDPEVLIDGDQMLQVLTNLISNAFQAMDKGGVLTIETSGDDEKVELRVSDTGHGIAPDNIKKIFEPFFTTKSLGKGVGLGLAVTYGIVKMHRGEIVVESNADPSVG
ncbi:MAG: 4Fe-4S binding protein, partial [SAR324 cluster bacterium]|nr:4Fe-4S binding protein [SAR324 cluster bacterium]